MIYEILTKANYQEFNDLDLKIPIFECICIYFVIEVFYISIKQQS
jgi:hypothetical protein